jgi:Flp pilus assembly protein TadG
MFARMLKGRKALRRFGKSRKGSAAIEFALVVIPFFLLTFGLVEIAMIGLAQTSLNFAVSETARQIRTGQAQLNGVTEEEINALLCGEVSNFLVLSCEENLYLDVNTYSSFVDAGNDDTNPVEDGEFDDSGFGYTPGVGNSIVVVRAYYRWQILTPMFESVFENIDGGQRILISTMMFRNEPFT